MHASPFLFMRKKVISFEDYSFQYFEQSEPTLKHINLDIYEGEKVLILGPSGSGKSTLGNCINGLIPFAHKGKITGTLKTKDLENKNAGIFQLSAEVGTVLQDSDGQFIGLSVGEDVAFSLENDCVPQEEMKARVAKISELVGMEDFIQQNPHSLSGGQKQRVALAGVMVDDVDILLFDEPLANLDPKTGKVAIELIDDISKTGKTVIIIEHRLEDVLHRHVDRIVVMNEGEIVMNGTPDQVIASGILPKYGIREPLYVTACRYAGIQLTSEMGPAYLETLRVDAIKNNLQSWFEANHIRTKEIPNKPLLKVEDVSFSYDGIKDTLSHISLEVREGEMLSIVGKNGAGKTTFSSILCGFLKPDNGKITMQGEDLAQYTISERANYIGIVMQNPNQMISKTMIFDEVAFGLRIRNYPEEEINEKVHAVLRICGLYEFRNWPISALSFGQKKRVTIASILVLNPKILILDEPTAGQDYHHYSEIMEFLKELNEQGQTIVMITHDMHLMLEYTNRAVVISDGALLADQEAYEVLCDLDLIERANLKETSLFDLAKHCQISDPLGFVECFIHYDRKVRNHEI